MTALRIENLSVELDHRRVVDGVSFAARAGELIGLIGANGVGKSTLLRAIAGVTPIATGDIVVGEASAERMAGKERARSVAFLPQGQTVHWPIDVHQLTALGRLPHLAPLSRISAEDEAAITAAMRRADVAQFADRQANLLSAGERARVLLARALAVEAPILLADEPTAALDPLHQLQVMTLLADLAREGRLVIVVLHDLALAARYCERLLLMDEGRILADGAPVDVLTADNLAKAYGVEAYFAERDGRPIVLPWRPI